jgi:hypothetical protein
MHTVFAIIADPNRRAILRLFVSSHQTVGDIERHFISMGGATGWQRLNAEYAKQFGSEAPALPPQAAQ